MSRSRTITAWEASRILSPACHGRRSAVAELDARGAERDLGRRFRVFEVGTPDDVLAELHHSTIETDYDADPAFERDCIVLDGEAASTSAEGRAEGRAPPTCLTANCAGGIGAIELVPWG